VLKEKLQKIVQLQKNELKTKELGINREIKAKIDIKLPFATILTGIRRSGKSTILNQIISKQKKWNYFHFEDIRLGKFEESDFEKLLEIFEETNPNCKYYFFDEIQNVIAWEKAVRFLLDQGKYCIITGSNASLLSKELGTRLTGRHLNYEVFPFSYLEMLKLTKKAPSIESFENYFKNGGFPEFLKTNKIEILQELFKDIIYRDIIVRYKLRDEEKLQKLALYLLTNIGKEFSYNKLTKVFNFGSTNSVISHIEHFENSYLLFSIPKFDFSYKKQIIGPKKVYTIDTGFSSVNSTSFSNDKGRILENIVFLHLRRQYKEIFFFQQKNECDFIVKDKNKAILAIQVCYKLNSDNLEREINGLKQAMEYAKIKKGAILTYNQTDKIDGIPIIPVWKWLQKPSKA